jgi:uncharacterized protein
VRNGLKTYLEDVILPVYATLDDAHRPDHVRLVAAESLDIAKSLDVDFDMVMTVAFYHDIGLIHGRDLHHLSGARMLREDDTLKGWFSQDEIDVMAQAVEDHRASNKTPPRSVYGAIIAEADRDLEPEHIIRRTVRFGFHHYPELDVSGHVTRAYDHIRDKYGPSGYLTLWLRTETNMRRLDVLHSLIGDETGLKRLIEGQVRLHKKG